MSDENERDSVEQFEEWKRSYEAGQVEPKETYQRVSSIALLLMYDLIDKLRYWEKETLELPDDQIVERVEHLTATVDRLRRAYLDFGEVE
jgi:hypothetical protein